MARKTTRGTRLLSVEINEDVVAQMRKQAQLTGRSIREEWEHAARRHLASPPVMHEPPLGTSNEESRSGK